MFYVIDVIVHFQSSSPIANSVMAYINILLMKKSFVTSTLSKLIFLTGVSYFGLVSHAPLIFLL